MNETYPFKLKPLPYPYNSLEPYIDEKTMHLHHDKHLKKYVDTLNSLLKDYPMYHNYTLEKLILNIDTLPEEIREKVKNNAGGVYNHNLYFDILNGGKNTQLGPNLERAINLKYNSFDEFYKEFKEKALSVFGSGYAWFVINNNMELDIVVSKNQDVPLNVIPIFLIDVWEHAYYLKYNNRRDEYIDNFKNIIDFKKAEERYKFGMNYFN